MKAGCVLSFVLAGVLLAAAYGADPSSAVSAGEEMPVIGHLEKSGQIITIYAGEKGPLYTVKTKEGKIIAEKIDDTQLQARLPDLYRDLKSAVAGNDASLIGGEHEPVVIIGGQ